jgi:hypothetical protein
MNSMVVEKMARLKMESKMGDPIFKMIAGQK